MTTRLRTLMTAMLLGALAAGLVACGAEPSPSASPDSGRPPSLLGTSWRVVSVGARQPVIGREPTVAFDAERVSGSGGCNSFGGTYRYDPAGPIAFSELGMTAMACAEQPINELETAFMQALTTANLVSVDARGLLVLSGPGGQISLAPAAPRLTGAVSA